MTQAIEPPRAPKPVKPASYVLVGTRLATMFIALVMVSLSLKGEQQLAKLALSGVTVGTLLLTPDIASAVLGLRPKTLLSEKTRKQLTDLYIKLLSTCAVVGVIGLISVMVKQVGAGTISLAFLVACSISLALLGLLLAIGLSPLLLPVLLPRWSRNIAEELPASKRAQIQRLSVRIRIRLASFETNAVPAGVGVVLFLAGTALQFILLATAHATAHP